MSYHDSIVVVIVAGKGVPQRLYYLFIGNNTLIKSDSNNNDTCRVLYLITKRYNQAISNTCLLYMFCLCSKYRKI